ncbi:MAG TPA: glycosyltransferase [Rhizobiaceae bacterium]|nr:glycosyltransferase [Rhizobiaceae bacterium]
MPDHTIPLAETSSPGSTRLVCVGTATRNRPFMLQRLLASYEKLFIPPEIAVRFVIVENNPSPTLEALVENFRTRVPWSVQYEIEPRPGIAFVRNRVLDLALTARAQFLTFADDDEEVDRQWLAMLLAESDASDLDIVGSPVRVAPLKDGKGLWPRLLWQGLDQARRGKEKRAAKYRTGGRTAEISIPTGSWLGRLAFFERTGLRFDERYNLSGNEDGRLWLRAKELGARTGWAPDAIAFESLPLSRLTMRYQFRRSADYTAMAFRDKFRRKPARTWLRVPASMCLRIAALPYHAIALPFAPGHSLVRIAWNAGALVGIVRALFGGRSNHYMRS